MTGIFLPLWNQCVQCGNVKRCPDPFAPSGLCPTPEEAAAAPLQPHPVRQELDLNPAYQQALDTGVRFASIAERVRRQLPVPNADFFYLRQLTTSEEQNTGDKCIEPLVAIALLWDCLHNFLHQQHYDFVSYYDLDPTLVDCAQAEAFRWSVDYASPAILHHSEQLGYDWGSHLLEVMNLVLWGNLVRSYNPIETFQDPERFRSLFEVGWKELLLYRGAKFDFRVTPKLSPRAMVRYQALPRGDRTIRNTISSYMVHQATAYPHLTDRLAPGTQQHFYRDYLRQMFTPFVRSVAGRVLHSLSARRADQKRLKAGVTEQVWKVFNDAVDTFRFHYPVSGKETTPTGRLGFLGLAESAEERQSFDAFLHEFRTSGTVGGTTPPDWMTFPAWMYPQGGGPEGQEEPAPPVASEDLTHVLFTRYLTEHFKTWRLKNYPLQDDNAGNTHQVGEPVPTVSLDAPEFEAVSQGTAATTSDFDRVRFAATETPILASQDGTIRFLSIQQAARRLGVSEVQLRYLERNDLFHPRRAQEIVRDITIGDAALRGDASALSAKLRLYPDTEESMAVLQAALLRVQTRSTQATLPGETTRKVVAVHLGVPESRLRSWEGRGLLKPQTRGRTVVYTPECIEKARALVAANPKGYAKLA